MPLLWLIRLVVPASCCSLEHVLLQGATGPAARSRRERCWPRPPCCWSSRATPPWRACPPLALSMLWLAGVGAFVVASVVGLARTSAAGAAGGRGSRMDPLPRDRSQRLHRRRPGLVVPRGSHRRRGLVSTFSLFAGAATALIALGLYALIAHRNLLRKIIALNVLGSGVFLLLGAVAYRNGEPGSDGMVPDPVPHAMVLTGIVISVSATALALTLARRIEARSGHVTLSEQEGLE
jgi:multicomponent Na+:H+ antiporter subunit C